MRTKYERVITGEQQVGVTFSRDSANVRDNSGVQVFDGPPDTSYLLALERDRLRDQNTKLGQRVLELEERLRILEQGEDLAHDPEVIDSLSPRQRQAFVLGVILSEEDCDENGSLEGHNLGGRIKRLCHLPHKTWISVYSTLRQKNVLSRGDSGSNNISMLCVDLDKITEIVREKKMSFLVIEGDITAQNVRLSLMDWALDIQARIAREEGREASSKSRADEEDLSPSITSVEYFMLNDVQRSTMPPVARFLLALTHPKLNEGSYISYEEYMEEALKIAEIELAVDGSLTRQQAIAQFLRRLRYPNSSVGDLFTVGIDEEGDLKLRLTRHGKRYLRKQAIAAMSKMPGPSLPEAAQSKIG